MGAIKARVLFPVGRYFGFSSAAPLQHVTSSSTHSHVAAIDDRPGDPAVLGIAPSSSQRGPLTSSSRQTLAGLSATEGMAGAHVVCAASLVGRSHAAAGQGREDDFGTAVCADGTFVAAVADGVGDPKVRYAAMGAHLAARISCQVVQEHLAHHSILDFTAVLNAVSTRMVAEARILLGQHVDQGSLSTTLVVVAVHADGRFEGVSVGDSGAFELQSGAWAPLISIESNMLNAVGQVMPGEVGDYQTFEGVTATGPLLLATDGLGVPLKSTEVNEYFSQRWAAPVTLTSFIHDLTFQRRGEFDDRTALCIWKCGG